MQSLVVRLNKINDEIIHLLASGKGSTYANKDLITFEPGTIEKVNAMLAKRNLILEMMEEECKNP